MDFQTFLSLLPKISKADLPGDAAHDIMSPPERIRIMESFDWDRSDARTAAVMLLFYPRNDKTHFVLIMRNTYEGVHSAQISFPGGKRDPEDVSFEDTALRETCEEVGVTRDQVHVVRGLSRIYIPPSNFIVYPFIGYCSSAPIFTPNAREVAGIIEVSLDDLLDDANVTDLLFDLSYAGKTSVPGFQIGKHVIWGATGMILSEFKEVMNAVARS